MLICMKMTRKPLDALQSEIAKAKAASGFTYAQIGRLAGVHPSQVTRVCQGNFKTLSHNVMQICNVLNVTVPPSGPEGGSTDPEWVQALANMERLWDQTPEGAKKVARVLEAIADLRGTRQRETSP